MFFLFRYNDHSDAINWFTVFMYLSRFQVGIIWPIPSQSSSFPSFSAVPKTLCGNKTRSSCPWIKRVYLTSVKYFSFNFGSVNVTIGQCHQQLRIASLVKGVKGKKFFPLFWVTLHLLIQHHIKNLSHSCLIPIFQDIE